MKIQRKPPSMTAIFMIVAALAMAGCSPAQNANAPQIKAINTLRVQLDLPRIPLQFVELGFDGNSPSGNLQVAVYKDTEGRKYFVDPLSNQVVEMDARALLDKITPQTSVLSEEAIRGKAMRLMAAAIPGFENLRTGWTYEEGGKVDNYFFTWYGEMAAGGFNRPRAQIALHRTGLLFAYYNSLLLDQ
jgi:hypothetical protein